MLSETKHYLDRLEDLRGQIGNLIAELPAEALNWRPIERTDLHEVNSLAVMATHAVGAEHFWIHEVIGHEPATRNRQAEFETVIDSPAPLLAKLAETGERTRAIITALTAADLEETRTVHDEVVSVRWALLHVIDHTSLHLGHMQITYQLWNHGRGVESPRWYERKKS